MDWGQEEEEKTPASPSLLWHAANEKSRETRPGLTLLFDIPNFCGLAGSWMLCGWHFKKVNVNTNQRYRISSNKRPGRLF